MKYKNVKKFSVVDLVNCWGWDVCNDVYDVHKWNNIDISKSTEPFDAEDLEDLIKEGFIKRQGYDVKVGDIVTQDDWDQTDLYLYIQENQYYCLQTNEIFNYKFSNVTYVCNIKDICDIIELREDYRKEN